MHVTRQPKHLATAALAALAALAITAGSGCSSSSTDNDDDATVPAETGTADKAVAEDTATPSDTAAPDQAPADGAPDKGPGKTCEDLEDRYERALKEALKCNAVLPMPQCNTKVDDALRCPCPIYVNEANDPAIKDLSKLKDEWTTEGCGGEGCPPNPCDDAKQGNCQPQGGTSDGLCEK